MENNAVDNFQEKMESSIKKYYSSQLSDNINRALLNNVKKGIWCWRPPYGYVKHENKISIDRRQSKVVKKIFKLKSEGYTITQIQYKTRRAKLSAGQITRILKNVFYIGYIKHKGSYYPHKHGRIV